ncbi:hypothetical protein PRIEUP_LOCUS965, partial [Pristimantis euphronides]
MQLDETVCSRPVCQHPQCWVSLQRIEQSLHHYRLPPTISRHSTQDEAGRLPVLTVRTILGSRTLHDGSDGHHQAMEDITRGASSTALYRMYNTAATGSMEKVFFPAVNSYREIIAPSGKLGFCISSRKSQRVKILDPSFQETRNKEVTMVWVPNAQHKTQRAEDREKPLKVCIQNLSLKDIQGGTRRKKQNPTLVSQRDQEKKLPTGGCPFNLTLVRSSHSPSAKNYLEASGIMVENRQVVLHDSREKCPVVPHTGPVYRLDKQSTIPNNMEIGLHSITYQYYLWKKHIHQSGPNHRIKPPDHRISKTQRSQKSLFPDPLGHIGLFPYDPDSVLSYYKSQASQSPTGSVICDTRSHGADSRHSASLAEFSQRSWVDEEPSTAVMDSPQPTEIKDSKRVQQEAPGEKNEEAQPAQLTEVTPERPELEDKDVSGGEESTGSNASPNPPKSAVPSTDVHQTPEQKPSSPQPNPPPPSPM